MLLVRVTDGLIQRSNDSWAFHTNSLENLQLVSCLYSIDADLEADLAPTRAVHDSIQRDG